MNMMLHLIKRSLMGLFFASTFLMPVSFARAAADLWVTDCDFWNDQTEVQHGSYFRVDATGHANADVPIRTLYRSEIFLSLDTTLDTTDISVWSEDAQNGLVPTQWDYWERIDIDESIPVGLYYIIFHIDSTDIIPESNEANNVSVSPGRISVSALEPDLTITDFDLNTSDPITVQSFRVDVTGKNVGSGYAGQERIYVYLSDNSTITTSDRLIGNNTGGQLDPDEQRTLDILCNLPSDLADGTYYLGAIIDPANTISEEDETNNKYLYGQVQVQQPEPIPDIAMISVTGWGSPVNEGDTVTVNVTMENKGDGDAQNFHIGWYLGAHQYNRDKLARETGGHSLDAGEEKTVTLTYTYQSGDSVYGAETIVLDNRDEVDEEDQWGKESSHAVTIIPATPQLPDFIVTDITLSPVSPAQGQSFDATVTVKNQGAVSGDGGWLDVWTHQSTPVSTGDDGAQSWRVNSLAVNETRAFTFTNLQASVDPGEYAFRAFVDSQGNTDELDDANNQESLSYTVTGNSLPDITVRGSLTFYDAYLEEWRPARFVHVDIMDNEPFPLAPRVLASSWTDSNGAFSATVPNAEVLPGAGGVDIFVRFYTEYGPDTQKGIVLSSGILLEQLSSFLFDPPYYADTSVHGDMNGTELNLGELAIPESDSKPWQFFSYGLAAYLRLKDIPGGYDCDRVRIWYPDDTLMNAAIGGFISIKGGQPVSYYHPIFKIISIRSDESGPDTVFHEYGHAAMDKMYQGIPPDIIAAANSYFALLLGNLTSANHWPTKETFEELAFLEGWAEFFQEFVRESFYEDVGWSDFESGFEYLGNAFAYDWRGQCLHYADAEDHETQFGAYECDGARVEGAVAELFWDLYDGGASDNDQDGIDSAISEVLTIFRTRKPNTISQFAQHWRNDYPATSSALGAVLQRNKIERSSDTTAPQSLQDFVALVSNSQVQCSWTLPADSDLAGSVVIATYPEHSFSTLEPLPQTVLSSGMYWPSDFQHRGLPAYRVIHAGPGASCLDHTPKIGTNVYWAYAYDQARNYSSVSTWSVNVTSGDLNSGTITVMIEPSAAQQQGGMWRVPPGQWLSSGATLTGIAPGNQTIEFADLAGWTKPDDILVSVIAGENTSSSGTYVLEPHWVFTPGSPMGPQSAPPTELVVFNCAASSCSQGHTPEYRFDWGDGNTSTWAIATSSSHLWSTLGSFPVRAQARCSEEPQIMSPWSSPSVIRIAHTVMPPDAGAVKVLVEPTGVRDDGGEWQLDSGQWQASGSVINDVPVGQHVVNFKSVSGWLTPAAQVVTVSSGQTNLLTGTYAMSPVSSGSPIVFSSNRSGNYDIWRMNPDGSGLMQLTSNEENERYPQWSPDGQTIAFARGTNLMLMASDGSNQRAIYSYVNGVGEIRWAPDGSYLAYNKRTSSDWFAPHFRIDPDGANEGSFIPDYGKSANMTFGRNGTNVIWAGHTSNWEPNVEIYTAPVVSGAVVMTEKEQITSNSTSDGGPRYSPDYTRVLYHRSHASNGYSDPRNIHIMNPDGSGDTQVTFYASGESARDGAFSPDGSQLVFTYQAAGKQDICIVNTDGSGFVNLTSSTNNDVHAHWRWNFDDGRENLLEEDFEDYTVETWPDVLWVQDANASDGSKNRVEIDPAGGGSQALRLYGVLGSYWAAITYAPCAFSNDFFVSCRVYNGTESIPSSGHQARGSVGMRQGTSWSNPARNLFGFQGDGTITGGGLVLGTYTPGRWYDVVARYQRNGSLILMTYWVDGEFKGRRTVRCANTASEETLDHIELQASAGSAWFDDIRVYLPKSADGGILYAENFDSYAVGELPAGWTRYYNASSDPSRNAVVTNAHFSGENAFQVYGQHSGMWAAHMTRSVDLSSLTGWVLLRTRFQCSGDIETTASGHYFELQFGFDSQSDGEGGDHGVINVGWDTKGDDMGAIAANTGVWRPMRYGVWYDACIALNLDTLAYRVWIDGVELGSGGVAPSRPSYLKLSSGGGKAWIDDVLLATGIPEEAPLDEDSDELEDVWEKLHYQGLSSVSFYSDWDGDGVCDGFEEIAGTSPTDASRLFRITSADSNGPDTGELVITWDSVEGRIYTISSCSNLTDGVWTQIAEVPGDGTSKSYTSTVSSVSCRFLQLDVRKDE